MSDKKPYHDLTEKDITTWDLNILKGMAKEELVNRNIDPSTALIYSVFHYIHAKGMRIQKDPDREATWSEKSIHGFKKKDRGY